MHILITGGLGYLGSRLAHYLHGQGHQISIGTRQHVEVMPKGFTEINCINMDWGSYESIHKACNNVDIVVHAAGMNAQECFMNPLLALHARKKAAQYLSDAGINQKIKSIIYLSSMRVYGENLSGTINEQSPTLGMHPYAQSHIEAEQVLLERLNNHSVEIHILRLANIFGAPIIENKECWDLVVNNFCMQAVKTGEILINSARTMQKSFLPMTDFLRVIGSIIDGKITSIHGGILNVGNPVNLSLEAIAKKIQLACSGVKVSFDLQNDIKCNQFEYKSLYLKEHELGSSMEKEINELLQACERC